MHFLLIINTGPSCPSVYSNYFHNRDRKRNVWGAIQLRYWPAHQGFSTCVQYILVSGECIWGSQLVHSTDWSVVSESEVLNLYSVQTDQWSVNQGYSTCVQYRLVSSQWIRSSQFVFITERSIKPCQWTGQWSNGQFFIMVFGIVIVIISRYIFRMFQPWSTTNNNDNVTNTYIVHTYIHSRICMSRNTMHV